MRWSYQRTLTSCYDIGSCGVAWGCSTEGAGLIELLGTARMSSQALLTIGSVSVVVPVHNAERFIEAALRSALAEPEVGEVLVIDDGSSDRSREISERLAAAEPRVRLLQHPDGRNHGASASRNLGIRSANLPFIAFLDADDRYLPGRFAAERTVFSAHAEADGVYGALGAEFHDERAREAYMRRFGSPLVTVARAVSPDELRMGVLGAFRGFGHFSIVALTVRAEALKRQDRLFDEELGVFEDTDFIVRLAWTGRLYPGSIARPVALRGVHAENRITRVDDEGARHRKLFHGLERWSRAAGLPRAARRQVILRRVHWDAFAAKGWSARAAVLIDAVTKPWVLRHVPARDRIIEALLGGWPWLAAKARAFCWRFMDNDPAPL